LTRCRISSIALPSVQIAETVHQHDGGFVPFAAGSDAAAAAQAARARIR